MKIHEKKSSSKRYFPLGVFVLIAAVSAFALVQGMHQGFSAWMHFFMGLIFCQFAMLKLFNLSGFADGFQMYDLVGKRFRLYAYLYPFIELGLGVAYLSFSYPILTYFITLTVMGVGAVGVVRALKAGLDVRCACMGTALNVPLSTVTLSEDIVMGAMALMMLVSSL